MTYRSPLLLAIIGIASMGCSVHVHDAHHHDHAMRVVHEVRAPARGYVEHRPSHANRPARQAASPRAVRARSTAADSGATDARANPRHDGQPRRSQPRDQRPDEADQRNADRAEPRGRSTNPVEPPGQRGRDGAERRDRPSQSRGRSTDPAPPPGRPKVREVG